MTQREGNGGNDLLTTRAQQIAHIVRTARMERGWSQAELGERAGVHKGTIGNFERAEVETQPELLARLAEILDVDLSAASLAGQALIDVVVLELTDKMRELGETKGLIMASEVLQFVTEWQEAPPRSQGRRADSA